jgi:hypothetical protein
MHTARLRPARWELVSRVAAWDELVRCRVSVATVPFRGRAGRGGEIDVVRLERASDDSREVRLWPGTDELADALAAPVWGRFATFAGHPLVRAEVIWTVDRRSVVMVGRRGDQKFEERAERASSSSAAAAPRRSS